MMIFVFCILSTTISAGFANYDKVCQGTTNGLNLNRYANNYDFLETYYNNCQIIDGNLELTNVDKTYKNDTFDFLSNIKEITGYLLIFQLQAEILPFHNLRIIRGVGTFKEATCLDCKGYSLYVKLTSLKELHLPNLTEISNGHVKFSDNANLCYVDTIDWQNEIFYSNSSTVTIYKTGQQCDKCPNRCKIPMNDKKSCWSKNYCQQVTKCPPHREACKNRCQKSVCCHDECSAGCYAAFDNTCNACKHVNYEGRCVVDCPPLWIANSENNEIERNPEGRVNYANQCKFECPAHMVLYDSRCMAKCPVKTFNENFSGVCVACKGNCPKTCEGTGNEEINSTNFKKFEGCQSVAGSIKILDSSFKQIKSAPPLTISDLSVLNHVTEIQEFLVISVNLTLTNLGFLKNLEVIQGRLLYKKDALLIIHNSHLEQLNLNSLRRISRGNLGVYSNPKLCYVDSLNWT